MSDALVNATMLDQYIKHVMYDRALSFVFDNLSKNINRTLPVSVCDFKDTEKLIHKWKAVLTSDIIGRQLSPAEQVILAQSLEHQKNFNKYKYVGSYPVFQQYTLPIIARLFQFYTWNYSSYDPKYNSTIYASPDVITQCYDAVIFGQDAEASLLEWFNDQISDLVYSNNTFRGILLDFKSNKELDIYV